MARKLTRKEKWYFIRQDINSYLISTFLYVGLCLIRSFTIQTVLYAIFDCLIFYVPFWFIRINFADTYHSDSWKHCKMWTRIMLCVGVFALWILPIKYSLFNGLFVAFVCCLILYLISLEVNEKKSIKKENEKLLERCEKLQAEIKAILEQVNDPKEVILNSCRKAKLSKRDTEIAVKYYCEGWQAKDIWLWLCENKEYDYIEWDSVHQLLWRIGKKIK